MRLEIASSLRDDRLLRMRAGRECALRLKIASSLRDDRLLRMRAGRECACG
jgi:hypothetical protein